MPDAVALPVDNSPAALQAQLANATYNARNALYSAASASALAQIKATNPSIYLEAVAAAGAADAQAEAAKQAAAFSPLQGINPASLAGMSQSQIAGKYGSGVSNAVSDYYRQNPSSLFQNIVGQYGTEHNAIVGSSGTLTPAQQVTFQPYNTPATQAMLGQQAKVPGASLELPTIPIVTGTAVPTASIDSSDTYLNATRAAIQNTPLLSFIYGLGESFGANGRAAALSETARTTPGLSFFYGGGTVFEARQNAGYKAQQASDLYNQYDSQGLITHEQTGTIPIEQFNQDIATYNSNKTIEGYNNLVSEQLQILIPKGTFTGSVDQLSKLQGANTAANLARADDVRIETPIFGTQVTPWTMPLASWAFGASQAITDASKTITGGIDSVVPVAAPVTHFVTGVGGEEVSLVPYVALALPAVEWGVRNPGAMAFGVAPGVASQASGMITQAKEDPAQFAGNMVGTLFGGEIVGQSLLSKGVETAYEIQPYRIGIERAEISPSSGTGGPTARYSALGVTKLSGADYQIAQIFPNVPVPKTSNIVSNIIEASLPSIKGPVISLDSSGNLLYRDLELKPMLGTDALVFGAGGKITNPVDVILNSDLLKTTTNAKFVSREATFSTADEAMARYSEVVGSGRQNFYHATGADDFIQNLLSTGKTTVGGSREGALFFAPPEQIYAKYATRDTGVPTVIRLNAAPEMTQKYLDVVEGMKSDKAAFGAGFSKTAGKLPEGFYPGMRAAAGKSFGSYGLEEEYIVSPGTNLYLNSARSVTGPSGQQWLLVDVSLNKPLIPDIMRGAVQTANDIVNFRPFVGVPVVPEEYFNFGSPEITFAPNTPLETSIVKNLAPEEAAKYNLGYGVREITSGSGARLNQATTAINEVVLARRFPNPERVTEAILQTEIDYGVKMYGSAIQKGVGEEQGIVTLPRPPNDIDIYVPNERGLPTNSLRAQVAGTVNDILTGTRSKLGMEVKQPEPMGLSFANDVTAAINRAAGRRVVEVDAAGTVSLTDGSGKLFDIHNENPTIDELLSQGSNPNKPLSPYYGIGMKTEKFLETPEGIEVMTYSEQVGRKLSGTSEFTPSARTTVSKVYEGGPEEFSVTGKIGPRFEGRMKDIPDFYSGEKGNIELMQRSANPLARVQAGRANVMLEQWLDTWGEPAATATRENYQIARTAGDDSYAINLAGVSPEGSGVSSVSLAALSPVYSAVVSPASAFSLSSLSGISPGGYEAGSSVSTARSPAPTSPAEFSEMVSAGPSRGLLSPSRSSVSPSERPSPSAEISPDYSFSLGSVSPGLESESPLSAFSSGLYPPSSPPSLSPPGSPPPYNSPPPPTSTSIFSSGSPGEDYYKKRRKRSPSIVFREILPIITPIEEVGGFKYGKSFFRAIGNQQILKVTPQRNDWLHYVDVDVDSRDLAAQQQGSNDLASNLTGMSFFRTATKQEKAKAGKPILKYTPTQQEINMAKVVGFGASKSKKGRKSLWF